MRKTRTTITVSFFDGAVEVYTCGVESKGTTEAHRCAALHSAYEMAAMRGVNVGYLRHVIKTV